MVGQDLKADSVGAHIFTVGFTSEIEIGAGRGSPSKWNANGSSGPRFLTKGIHENVFHGIIPIQYMTHTSTVSYCTLPR
jgi:hypothetical protein